MNVSKQLIVLLLVALFATVAVSAQITEQADQELSKFFKAFLVRHRQQEESAVEQADLVLTPALIKKLIRTPANYILTDEEINDKTFWKKALKVVGEIGKAAIKDYINKNWDEIPEEEADIKLGKLFKAVLPYLKEGAKQYINNNWDAEEMADKKWSEVIKSVMPYIKAGVKNYIANNWDEEADKGFWSKVWNIVKEVGKGAAKDYVNKNWDEEMELSDKFWGKVWKVVKEIGKGAVKSYVNQNFDSAADAQKIDLGKVWKTVLPYIKAGVKDYINKNWDQNEEMSDLKLGKIFKKAVGIAKGLGKAYLTSQFGIPLEDLPQSDKFLKNILKLVRDELKKSGKEYIKSVLNAEQYDEEADAELKFKEILRAALPYLKEGVKGYINNNWDEAADNIDYEKLFRIALPYLRRQI